MLIENCDIRKVNDMKVCKFGGSSLADANQVRKVVDIVGKDKERRIIVVSAPGKVDDDDIKITDLLIDCANKKTAALITAVRLI
jgi:Aspartokinases